MHYQSDPDLRNIVILYPEWSTNALYKILDAQETILRGRNGILYLQDLPKIWTDKDTYPEDKYLFLLRIMEKFDLCYSINKDTFLVAELLETVSIDYPSGWNLNMSECICVDYKYDFMPAGIMTRFIVKIHDYIAVENEKNLCWKKGVYLTYKSTYACVSMKDSISEKMIQVRVHKTSNSIDERELLYKIRDTIESLNNTFSNLEVEEFVPCNCSEACGYKFPYKVLGNALKNSVKEIQCYNSFKSISILNLLEGIEMNNKEEMGQYSIKIENNPVITTNISSSNTSSQINMITIQEIRTVIMEMQGDISEIQEELANNYKDEISDIQDDLENIKNDLAIIENMGSPSEVVKSGKINKLKRFLMNFSDENSKERKILNGIKTVGTMMAGLFAKYNNLAEKIGITKLPF